MKFGNKHRFWHPKIPSTDSEETINLISSVDSPPAKENSKGTFFPEKERVSDTPSPFSRTEQYPVNPPHAAIAVLFNKKENAHYYHVIEPVLTETSNAVKVAIENRLFETLDVHTSGLTPKEAANILTGAVDQIISDLKIPLSPQQHDEILYYLHRDYIGDGRIDAIMHDPHIEDISCDGIGTPLFVYHSRYESMETDITYDSAAELDGFVTRLAQRTGKYISIAEPVLDATMKDGSRVQMTLGTEVTARGSTFTIRKFRDDPITPTDLIEWGTFSAEAMAFIWLAVETGKSCIFAGGTASGKTTSLNAISLFIPPRVKIVSLEDTRELKLPHLNWIPSVTRNSYDPDGKGVIDMYELLRAALRQRPEYLIVGEVRGHEALTLFQAMSTGHITYATMHADSVESIVHRLENPPLNVPRTMLDALDLVSIQVQTRVDGKRVRRNKRMVEILSFDTHTHEMITNEVFRWDQATDTILFSGTSYILKKICDERGWSEARIHEEIQRRTEVLKWILKSGIRNYRDVSVVFTDYYHDPEQLFHRIRGENF